MRSIFHSTYRIASDVQIQAIVVILSFVGVGTVFISTSLYGAGLSPDSVGYISAARSLLSGDGYTRYHGDVLVHWPPLFPTLLAVLGLAGIEPLVGARIINILAFGLTIFFSGQLLRMYLRSNSLVILGTASVALSLHLLYVSNMVWT